MQSRKTFRRRQLLIWALGEHPLGKGRWVCASWQLVGTSGSESHQSLDTPPLECVHMCFLFEVTEDAGCGLLNSTQSLLDKKGQRLGHRGI